MSKKRILLVDDDLDFIDSLHEIVKAAGYEVEVAYDGQDALRKMALGKFDLIVLDIMMPIMDGHKFCKTIKQDPSTRETPVILLTSVADHVTTTKYTHYDMLVSDAEDYMHKPVEPDELLNRIKRLIQ